MTALRDYVSPLEELDFTEDDLSVEQNLQKQVFELMVSTITDYKEFIEVVDSYMSSFNIVDVPLPEEIIKARVDLMFSSLMRGMKTKKMVTDNAEFFK